MYRARSEVYCARSWVNRSKMGGLCIVQGVGCIVQGVSVSCKEYVVSFKE